MKKMMLEDYALLKGYFEQQPYRMSAYSLPSIIAWSNACYQSYYELTDSSVLVATDTAHDPGNRYLIMPITPDGLPSPVMLRDLALKMDYEQICFVPEDYVEQTGRNALEEFFEIIHQPKYDDYIYLTKDLSELKGNRYAKKRNLIHQFTREYVQHNRVSTGPITAEEVPECLEFLEKWCELRECEAGQEENVACEKAAVIQALTTIDDMAWRGLWVRVDGEICAFAIISHLTPVMGTLNFEKAYPHIKGLYQFLDNECARQLFNGYPYMNKESDMGLAALADSKRSYHPIAMLRAYCLKIKA
jgi:uncharacterized protein